MIQRIANRRAILLDRDGTLIEDAGYLCRIDSIVWKVGALEALTRLSSAGYLLFIVTNQSGIGRGLFQERDMTVVHNQLQSDIKNRGIAFEAIYHCPHRPNEGCACRKPGIALLSQAASEHDLDLRKSWFVGDKCSDIEAGTAANMFTALVYNDAFCAVKPHIQARTLGDAADQILAR